MKTILFLILAMYLFSNQGVAQTKSVIDCESKTSIASNNQKIKDNVYRNVGYIKGAKPSKISEDSLVADSVITAFHVEYDALQDEANAIFDKMRKDLQKLKSKKKICQEYGGELSEVVLKSQQYIKKLKRL